MSNPKVTKELLLDHFRGLTSARQRRLIDEWARDPENEDLFYQTLAAWEMSLPHAETDLERVLEAFRSKAQQGEIADDEEVIETPVLLWPRYVAACILLATALSGFFLRDHISHRYLVTGPGEVRAWTLPDGSHVSLNANSKLTLPRWGFGKDSREVTLTGEAAFDVTHLSNHQRFTVKTSSGIEVVVLGTEFSVYSRPNKMEVMLNKGKVKLRNQMKEIILAPGERFTSEKRNVYREQFDVKTEYATWQDSRFVFRATTLGEIADLLRTNYDVSVRISDPDLAKLTVSGSFKTTGYEDLAQSVSRILGIQCRIDHKQIEFVKEPGASE